VVCCRGKVVEYAGKLDLIQCSANATKFCIEDALQQSSKAAIDNLSYETGQNK
jgi:hypothetical protein